MRATAHTFHFPLDGGGRRVAPKARYSHDAPGGGAPLPPRGSAEPARRFGERQAIKRIGIDFDNTLADYDSLFGRLAVEEGLLPSPPAGGKRAVRDAVRALPGGEASWQRLQAIAYGPRMDSARLMTGASRFLRACRDRCIEVIIVSHKSRRAAADGITADLRESAAAWMEAKGFFDSRGYALDPANVHFEDSRQAKVRRIAEVAPSRFVDDLEEVFRHPGFPPTVGRLLFDPARAAAHGPGRTPFATALRRSPMPASALQPRPEPAALLAVPGPDAVQVAAGMLLDCAILSAVPVPGGGNNRVFRVYTSGGDVALKFYPSQPGDPRDRLGAETAALRFLERYSVAAVPRVVASSREAGMAAFT